MEVVDRVGQKDGTWREFGRSTLSRTLESHDEPPDDVSPVPADPPADARPPLPAAERLRTCLLRLPCRPIARRRGPVTAAVPLHRQRREYFRIWIVNLLLSLVTLGIYSAWAKVRRLRYFYGHTSVDGGTFGYHASPIAILKGRLIAYAVLACWPCSATSRRCWRACCTCRC